MLPRLIDDLATTVEALVSLTCPTVDFFLLLLQRLGKRHLWVASLTSQTMVSLQNLTLEFFRLTSSSREPSSLPTLITASESSTTNSAAVGGLDSCRVNFASAAISTLMVVDCSSSACQRLTAWEVHNCWSGPLSATLVRILSHYPPTLHRLALVASRDWLESQKTRASSNAKVAFCCCHWPSFCRKSCWVDDSSSPPLWSTHQGFRDM